MKIDVFLRPKISRIGMSVGICRIFTCPRGGGGLKNAYFYVSERGRRIKNTYFYVSEGGGGLKIRIFTCP